MYVLIPKKNSAGISPFDFVEIRVHNNVCSLCGARKFHENEYCDQCYIKKIKFQQEKEI